MSDNFQDVARHTLPTSPVTPIASPDDPSYALMLAVVRAALERKGANIQALYVAEVSFISDYFVIVTGFSRVQVRAIAQSIESDVAATLNRLPLHKEGMADGSWVLLDYGEAIAHILLPDEREFYNLEAFWGHADRVELPAELFEPV